MNPQLSWNLSDNNKQDSDKEKLLPQFDGELKEESCCDDNSDRSIKDDQVENRMFTMAALSPGFNQDLRYNNLLSPYMNAEDKVGIIKPKAMHIILQNPLSTPKISTNDEIREESKPINPMKKISEKEEYKTQDELYDSSKYEMINSIFPNGGQIKVMKIHLNRILKLRKIKRKCSDDNVVITPAVRIRSNEPIYDSRSKFATKRIRDKNGRFFTKEGYEEYLKRLYIDSVLSYISSHNFPGIDAQELRYKSYDEILAIFPERVFRIEHLKTRKTNR